MKKLFCTILFSIFILIPASVPAYTILPLQHQFDITQDFLQPTDAAVGKNNLIYVMDGVNSRVKVFDEKVFLNFLSAAGENKKGSLTIRLALRQTAPAVYTSRIRATAEYRYSLLTEPLRTRLGIPENENDEPPEPIDIAVNETLKQLYIADNNNHRIRVYSIPDYKLLSTRGSEGPGSNQFRYPFLMAAGNNDFLYIVDVLNTRVQVWQQDKPVRSIGGFGVDLGQFYRPKGVCVDKNGLVFVSDSVLGVIQAFSPDGTFSAVLGNVKGEVMKWKTPLGITLDNQGRLYVVEMLPNRVRVYDILYDQKFTKE